MIYKSSGSRPNEGIQVDFKSAGCGWIDCVLGLREGGFSESVTIRCSNYADPFSDMIKWLEALARGVDEASWTVDEEGSLIRLRAVRLREGLVLHIEEQSSDEPPDTPWHGRVVWRVPTMSLLCGMYCEFRRFVELPTAYRRAEWGVPTRFDQWEHKCGWEGKGTLAGVIEMFGGWQRDQVVAALFFIDGEFSDRDGPIMPLVSADWDVMPQEERREIARVLLVEKSSHTFGGDDLRTLKSPVVDAWLMSQKAFNKMRL